MKSSLSAWECGGTSSPGGLAWIGIFLLQTRGCVLSGAQLTDLTAVILSATGEKAKNREAPMWRGQISERHKYS